jgi:hypothetical protein
MEKHKFSAAQTLKAYRAQTGKAVAPNAGRHAKPSASAAAAMYRDCACRSAARKAESCVCKITRLLKHRTRMPNPSLKRSTNGRPPGPGLRYAVHFLSPGPGVLPLAPA